MRKVLVICLLIACASILLSSSIAMNPVFGPNIPSKVIVWKEALSHYPEGTAIVLADNLEDVELGETYGIPINRNVDFLWFSGGGIYSYSYPESYYDSEWVAPKPTSVITYLDTNGDVIGTYQVKDPNNLPEDIEIRVKPYQLPTCHYKNGAYAELVETSELYVIEVYDDGGGWSAGCDS